MAKVIVLFEVNVKDGKMNEYLEMAEALKESLAKADGFISSERFTSIAGGGKILSMSVWENEQSISKWRNQSEHRICQRQGRLFDFEDYKITVAVPTRTYTVTERYEAPTDSNKYLEA